jgi:hypothetical protein
MESLDFIVVTRSALTTVIDTNNRDHGERRELLKLASTWQVQSDASDGRMQVPYSWKETRPRSFQKIESLILVDTAFGRTP